MDNNYSICRICGSINVGNHPALSGYKVCYYCYTIENKKTNIVNNIIGNDNFETLIADTKFDFKNRSNIIILNSKSNFFNNLSNVKCQDLKHEEYTPNTNSFLKNGKIDTVIIPNIENINFNLYIRNSLRYFSENIEIFIGFYTSVERFKSENELNNIKYIYNIYAIHKILQQANTKLYISDFWKKDDYILFKINKNFNRDIENSLQLALDKIFYSNFQKEISL